DADTDVRLTLPVSKLGNTVDHSVALENRSIRLRKIIEDRQRVRSFRQIDDGTGELGKIAERLPAPAIGLPPVVLHFQKPTLPSIQNPALHGVPAVGEFRSEIHTDRCGNPADRIFESFHTALARTVFAGAKAEIVIRENLPAQS